MEGTLFRVATLPQSNTCFPRGDATVDYDIEKDLEFQITDWHDRDVALMEFGGDEEEPDEKEGIPDPRSYIIDVFGVTKHGHSVSCTLSGYKPHFYIKTGEKSKNQIEQFIKENITHKQFMKRVFNKNNYEQELEPFYLKRSFTCKSPDGDVLKYTYESVLDSYEIVRRQDLGAGFTGIPPKQFQFVKLVFNNENAMKSCYWMLNRDKEKLKIGIYESKIPPMLRFMHTRGVLAAGWVKLAGGNYNVITNNTLRDTITQIEIKANWEVISPIERDDIAPIRQASFDIECYSSNHGRMPVPEDPENKCIQIATTIYDYGIKEMKKHIIVLGECGDIQGVTVVRCKTEAELLCTWSKFLRESDPDIVHGYNIFGFDLNYIVVRAKLVECFEESSYMGRFKNMPSDIVEKELISAAYGANYMKLLPMPGRLHIDVLKVIQKDFIKYPSYKLGFISQEVLSNTIKTNMIETTEGSSIIRVHHPKHSYTSGMVINLIDVDEFGGLDYYDFNRTHIVSSIDENSYTFDVTHKATKSMRGGGDIIRVFETKHDLTPKQMFEYFASGEPDKIRTIAEYCVQDTLLPQKIINKKCILEDLIAMANVTSVPVGYLIIRGQQIKVYSLLTQFCRAHGILVPTIETSDKNLGKNRVKFKGATVLTALSGAYFDGIACLDFSALYPSNMIDWNLCYSTIVRDAKYMNLPGVKYHTFDLGHQKYTYAQSEEGILQKMLNHLLNARSKAKKKMAEATDPFMKNKYNCEQNAYKVTCNSVYGFTGAEEKGTLPCKPIAETTTFIGRKMLENAQQYGENPENLKDITSCKNYFPIDFTYLVMYENEKKCIFTGEEILDFLDVKWETLKSQKSVHLIDESHPNYLYKSESPKKLYVWTTDKWQQVSTLYAKTDVDPMKESERRWLMRVKTVKGEQLSFEKYACKIVYGDTDSVFCNFDTTHLHEPCQKIAYSMIIASYVSNKITDYLRSLNPYRDKSKMRTELAYEKVYFELFLLTKKRYVGSLYTFDPENMAYFDQKGVALKRRDYCKFVKEVFRNIIKCFFDKNVLDKEVRIENARKVVVKAVDDLLNNRVPFDKLVLSKLLKDSYKVREITNVKTKNGCRFTYGELSVGETVFWNDKDSGRCVGKIVKINDKTSIFSSTKEPAAKKVCVKPLEIECTKIKVQLKKKDSEAKTSRLIYDYENFEYPPESMDIFHLNFEDIAAKDGYTITLKTILDTETTEKELEGVSQAHVRLARRMFIRDPGSAPESGTRVPYVFVERADKNALQHDKCEDPDFAKKNNLKIDPEYYLLHQLETPISQMFALVMKDPEEKLFQEPLRQYKLAQTGQKNITSFFKRRGN